MEFVYVVPRAELFRDCYPQGLVPFGERFSRVQFEEAIRHHGFFVEREYAERNPALKQVIPYSIVRAEDRILLMRRLDAGGEERLHGKLSIGVGGHINPEDLEASESGSPVEAATRREIAEELDVKGSYEIRAVGLLNDDSNPVGAVHVGLVQIVDVLGSVKIREKDMLEGRLAPPGEIVELLACSGEAELETWSSILVESLDEILPEPLPATT